MHGDIGLGRLIEDEKQQRDAVHIAVAPVIADEPLLPGDHIGFVKGSTERVRNVLNAIGIVDPFLQHSVEKDERFFMFLYPGSITSLRHDWTHPAFLEKEPPEKTSPAAAVDSSSKEASIAWMRAWAVKHTPGNYYDDDEPDKPIDEEKSLQFAIAAGHDNHIGPYEDARDYIDNEWWDHWENITGEKAVGRRGTYFSCSC